MIEKYEQKVAPIVNEVVGVSATALPNDNAYSQEIALGNLIADSMRWQMKTDFAFMNPGGIRAGIDQGEVTWGELFTVQPFSNDLVKMKLTGAKVRELLEQQWGASLKTLQISGLKYTWDSTKPNGSKVVDIFLPDGSKLDPNAIYTVTVNNFMADGGDGYTALLSGTEKEIGPVDIDALVNYVKQLPQPFTCTVEGRITQIR
jgi:5'-nucleotidase